MFTETIPLISWILLGVTVVIAIFTLLYLLLPLRRMRKLPTPAGALEPEKELPKASVVIYSPGSEEILTEYLHSLTQQDYPDFEIIVVCDNTHEASDILAEKYSTLFNNVYVTFIQPDSRNLSRRKLALTVGIKAATGKVIVISTPNVEIPSNKWLEQMVLPFANNSTTEVVIGYSHPDFKEIHGGSRWFKEFISTISAANWISEALVGNTYRGDGYNIAFTRQIFFDHKGFSKTMHLHTGEDDLFVNEIATPENTALVLNSDTVLTTRWGDSANRVWSIKKGQYEFTSRWLPRAPFRREGAASAAQWITPICAIPAALLALPNIIPAIAAVIIIILFFQVEILIYRTAAARLHATRLWWALPIFWLFKPINNYFSRLIHRKSRFKNFTWQRKKH